MAEVRSDPRGQVDPAINSPGREGLTGTAPANTAQGFHQGRMRHLLVEVKPQSHRDSLDFAFPPFGASAARSAPYLPCSVSQTMRETSRQ